MKQPVNCCTCQEFRHFRRRRHKKARLQLHTNTFTSRFAPPPSRRLRQHQEEKVPAKIGFFWRRISRRNSPCTFSSMPPLHRLPRHSLGAPVGIIQRSCIGRVLYNAGRLAGSRVFVAILFTVVCFTQLLMKDDSGDALAETNVPSVEEIAGEETGFHERRNCISMPSTLNQATDAYLLTKDFPMPGTISALRPSPDWVEETRSWQLWESGSKEGGRHGVECPPFHKQASPWTLWWTEDAEALVVAALQANQFPRDCSTGTWMAAPTSDHGLLSTFHVFAAELVFAVAVGWPAVPVPHETNPAFDGCPAELRHLGCFFNITSCTFASHGNDAQSRALNQTERVKWYAIDPANVTEGSVVWPLQAKPNQRVGPWRQKVRAWFASMWKTMVEGKMVGTSGGAQVEMAEEWRKEFVVMSIVTKWLFNPHPYIPRLAETILSDYSPTPSADTPLSWSAMQAESTSPFFVFKPRHVRDLCNTGIISDETGISNTKSDCETLMGNKRNNMPKWEVPVLGLHIRQTDKGKEDPYWVMFKRYRPASEYGKMIRMLEEQRGYAWKTLLLMSDSDSAVQSYLLDPQGAGLRENLTLIHDHTLNVSIEDYGAHKKVPKEKKKELQEHFLAMLYLMSELADYSVVTLSSNVGRFIFECIGARKRVEQTSGIGPIGLSMDGEEYLWWNDYSHK